MSLGEGVERDNIGKKINDINTQLKTLDATIGNHQRNVGNYKEAFVGAFQTMGGSVKGMIPPVNSLDKSLKGLAKNPAMLVITALVGVIAAIAKGFKSSEENMNKLTTAFAGFKAVGDAVTKVLQAVAGWIGDLMNKMTELFEKWGWVGEKYKERKRIAEEEIKLLKKERAQVEKNAEVEAETAALRAKASEEDKYSYQQRIQFLEEAKKKEEENLIAERDILAAKLAIFSAQTSINDSTTEELNKLSEMKAALTSMNTRIAEVTRGYNKEINSLRKQSVAAKRQETETLLNLQKDLLQQEYDLEKQGSDRQLELAKEMAKKDYEIEKAGLEAKFKNKRMREQAEKLALKKYHAEIQKLETEHQENLFNITLQKQNDILDKNIALTNNKYKQLYAEAQKVVNEYNQKMQRGPESGQTQENFDKEMAELVSRYRKLNIDALKEMAPYLEETFKNMFLDNSKIIGDQTAEYQREVAAKWAQTFQEVSKMQDKYLNSFGKLSIETDEQYNERRKELEIEYQKMVLDVKKRYAESYASYVLQLDKDRESENFEIERIKKLQSYVDSMPHTVFDLIWDGNGESMQQMESDLQKTREMFEQLQKDVEEMEMNLWDTSKGYFNPEEAFKLLPEDVKAQYLSRLEELTNAEQSLLQQRYDN